MEEFFPYGPQKPPEKAIMSDETLWKERAEHYCKVTENLVQQVGVAARLGETLDQFKTHVNDGARQLNSILSRIGVAVCSLEATAKRFESIQAPMHQVETRTSTTSCEDEDAPDSDDLDDDDGINWVIEVKDADLVEELTEGLTLSNTEIREYFKFRKIVKLDLEFERNGADIIVSGRVVERVG